jgi:hypothetical protein
MYPENELIRLAAYKTALRRDIARRRAQCVRDTRAAVRPLAWMDRARAFCRTLQPVAVLAAAPLVSIVFRRIFPGQKLIGALLRWAPAIAGGLGALKHRRTAPNISGGFR